MRAKSVLIALVFLVSLSAIGCGNARDRSKLNIQSLNGSNGKKTILIVVDSLMPAAVDRGLLRNELPAFRYLIDHGRYDKNLVSSFPTMSVAIDSSLVTGRYPDGHGVPGLTWYSEADDAIVNYGTGPSEAILKGIGPVLSDALINLNGNHLSRKASTIYEDLARRGFTSGSINGLIYRGKTSHSLTIPWWIRLPASLDKRIAVKGPDFMTLGAVLDPLKGEEKLPQGPSDKLGMNNAFAIETAIRLVRTNKLPDFLYVYLPDLDQLLHKHGPPGRGEDLVKLDRQLMSLLQAFGSPDAALNKATFVLLGDSGMTRLLPRDRRPVIDLPALLGNPTVYRPGERSSEAKEIALAVNETTAYVYKLHSDRSIPEYADRLIKDARIDFAAWTEGEWTYVLQGTTTKRLRFKSGGATVDTYGQRWTVQGATEVLDLRKTGGRLAYDRYPDALKRLAGALSSHRGTYLIVDAKPGYELADVHSPEHANGGGHGSLGKQESLVPLIVSGTKRRPASLRIVDMKDFLMKIISENKKDAP